MAEQEVRIDPDRLSCSICTEPLKEPVTIPCGHSYCLSCIKRHWDHEKMTSKQKSVRCPICRKTFNKIPPLTKTTMLADLVEELKKTQDVGTVTKRRSSMSVEDKPKIKKIEDKPKMHKLTDICKSQKDIICSVHNEEKKIFCRTDQQCICYLCHLEKHKGHDSVSAEAEMGQRRKELEAVQQRTVQILQGIEKDTLLLQQKQKDMNRSADQMVSENEKMANEVITLITHMSSDLTHKIKQQQTNQNHQLHDLLRMKQKEKDLQKQRLESTNLEKLLQTVSYTQFLEKYPAPSKCDELSDEINLSTLHHFQNLTKALSQDKCKIKNTCVEVFTHLAKTVLPASPQCPKINSEFCDYSVQLALDLQTANEHLILSESKTKVTSVKEPQSYPPYLDRFQDKPQVLTVDPLPSCCYWEVEWSGPGVSVGVAYNDIKRVGPDSGFGNNDKSWVLDCVTAGSYIYRHKGGRRTLSPCESSRVRVFLDHKAGILRFYQVSETNKLIHQVQTRFTQPLYAGLGVHYYGATAKMCVKERENPEKPGTAQ